MTDPTHPPGSVFVVGANHRSSSLSVRDRLFVDDAHLPEFLENLKCLGLEDVLVLSTCDRVEVMGVHAQPEQVFDDIVRQFSVRSGLGQNELAEMFYLHVNTDAVRQIFRVASSLDSLVIGEPQVLGQLKAAHQIARQSGHVSGELETLLQSAYRIAKRIRTETRIGERPVSIASSACDIARGVHGHLSRVYVALIGNGEMGELIARQFQLSDVKGLTVSHPVLRRAEHLAGRLECHVVPFEEISSSLAQADIIICATGRRQHTLSSDMVRAALKARRNRPQLIIDAAIPGDVEPAVNRIDNAFLYELSDLDRVAMDGQSDRAAEADTAHDILEEELRALRVKVNERDAVPVLTQLMAHFEGIQSSVAAQYPDDAERATALLVSKLLHNPALFLRQQAADEKADFAAAERLLKDLFNLDPVAGTNETIKEDDA